MFQKEKVFAEMPKEILISENSYSKIISVEFELSNSSYSQKGEIMLENLIEWEKANGYKATFVAKKLGLTDSQYSKIKQGQQKPTIRMAEMLVKEFGIEDVYELLRQKCGGN